VQLLEPSSFLPCFGGYAKMKFSWFDVVVVVVYAAAVTPLL
jgi:hypothetical protein